MDAAAGPTHRPMQFHLETHRLDLRPFEPQDAQLYADLIAERGPGARGFGTTVEQARENIARLGRESTETGIGFLAIRRRGEPDLIGYCGLLIGRASLDEPEIAYELFRSVHGNGYATEAAFALIGAAAATGRRRLWSTVRTWNEASLRVLHKTGFHSDHVEQDNLMFLVRQL